MIRDVDRSKVVGPQVIESPVLGMITPLQLSGGVKTLLLIANDRMGKHVFNASTCGDNCAKWLFNLAEKRKVVVNLRHLMDFGDESFKLRVLNNNRIVRNMAERIDATGSYF